MHTIWIAGLRGKVRDHSSELRKGIAETLALLAVYGDTLFGNRLPVDIRTEIATLVRKLLTPLTMDRLLSQLDDLPAYTEAAPGTKAVGRCAAVIAAPPCAVPVPGLRLA